MKEDRSILYIVYAPYENQGKVLDYILEKFKYVFLFSLGHHSLGKGKKSNNLIIYKDKRILRKKNFLYIPVPPSMVFIFLPLRSIVNFFLIIYLTFRLYKNYGKISIYFSNNGYAAWMGLIIRRLGLVSKTSYWVCDFYPIKHSSKVILALRWLYWKFEKLAAKSDKLSFHNLRIVKAWKENGVLVKNFAIVPIGTDRINIANRRTSGKIKLVFLGVVKKSQGLDYIFDAANELQKSFPGIELNVLGSGPDNNYFKERAKECNLKTFFHGYVNEKSIDKLILRNSIGIAPYIPDPSNVSFYGDPGKIKKYVSLGLPVIATKTHEFSEQIKKSKAGIIVRFGNVNDLINAVKEIRANDISMSKNAYNLSKRYYYKDLYLKMFTF